MRLRDRSIDSVKRKHRRHRSTDAFFFGSKKGIVAVQLRSSRMTQPSNEHASQAGRPVEQ